MLLNEYGFSGLPRRARNQASGFQRRGFQRRGFQRRGFIVGAVQVPLRWTKKNLAKAATLPKVRLTSFHLGRLTSLCSVYLRFACPSGIYLTSFDCPFAFVLLRLPSVPLRFDFDPTSETSPLPTATGKNRQSAVIPFQSAPPSPPLPLAKVAR